MSGEREFPFFDFMNHNSEKLIEIAGCRSLHGIKGGFALYPFDKDLVLQVLKNNRVPNITIVAENNSSQSYLIKSISFGNKIVCYLEGIESRSEAEAVIPFTLLVRRGDFPILSEDEVYLIDLLGMPAVNSNTGESIGIISNYYDNGAQKIIMIENKEAEDIELPFIEQFFPEIDFENNQVKVMIPEYVD